MWNDEDNNPYGSFQRRDSSTSETGHQASPATSTLGFTACSKAVNEGVANALLIVKDTTKPPLRLRVALHHPTSQVTSLSLHHVFERMKEDMNRKAVRPKGRPVIKLAWKRY